MKKVILFMLLIFITGASYSQVRLPSVLSSNMVLQQQSTVKLWGWCAPAEKIFVKTSWNNRTDSIIGTRDANWQISIRTPVAGGPYTITINGTNQIILKDILIGEVWVCSGQSNMEMNELWGLADVKAELPNSYNSNIRFFNVSKSTSPYPKDDCNGQWTVCDSNTLKTFSAAGYFFGKKLNKELNVPVGLISSNWGGTAAEVWTPSYLIEADSSLKNSAGKLVPVDWWPFTPGSVFNAMVAPLTSFSIAGTIWYQGESNTLAPGTYSKLFSVMIDAWRKEWNKNFPFYYVQIAPFKYGSNNIGALVQEAQTHSTGHDKVGMVVINDLVNDTNDIHPINKHDVGFRLANMALAKTYGKTGFVYKSPVYKDMALRNDKVVITFDDIDTGLYLKGKKINELYVAGDDKIFYPAEGIIEKDKLVAWSNKIKKPAAVRYAFGNTAIGNLFSLNMLPVTPFRTDDWEVDTSPYGSIAPAANASTSSQWMGFSRSDFTVGGRKCLLIMPAKPASGSPWIWRTEFFGHEPQGDSSVAAKGFHVAYMDLQDMYGAPSSLDLMDQFYTFLTEKKGLSRKAVLEGFSRGGLFAFNWAARHPERVSCIYVDAPVCDFKSWPGGKGKGKGSAGDWEKLKKAYGFMSDKDALDYRFNPIDNLTPLARNSIPILCVCGETDDIVPMDENINIVEKRYKEMGGKITIIAKPNNGHHPHSLKNPAPIVDFILQSTPQPE